MSVMTQYTGVVAFGASHEVPGHPVCGKLHGHQYTVSFTFEGDPLKEYWGLPMTTKSFDAACDIVFEFKSRHLNDMLPAGHPTVSGLAAYLLERLRILGVVKVEVHESDTDVKGTAVYMAG